MFLSFVLFNLAINRLSGASPVSSDSDAMFYLASFGYLDPALKNTTNSQVDGVTFSRAISDFQSFAGLNPTGVLDEETKTWMSKPRCGVPDIIRQGSSARRKRDGKIPVWKKKQLTYRILKYTKHLEQSVVDREIARAFQLWADATELTFAVGQTEKVDIKILFESGIHDDDQPFDGPANTLAHAFFPPRGDTHFDEDETWTINSFKGADLFQVAVHEFGHALGLEHSKIKPAVMTPIYQYDPDFRLQIDDVERIQQLYGQSIDKNWVKEKFHEFTSALETLENELKATIMKLADAKMTIEKLKMTSNTGTTHIKTTDGTMPTSCQDLKLMGQQISGIFLVKNELRNKIDAVFCDFNRNLEVEQKRIGQVDVKSEIVYFYVQRSSPLHANHQTAIPFEIATFNIGTGMNLVEGIFTTPRTGIYFFSFTGLASFPVATTSDRVHLEIGMFLGGVCISKAQTEETNTVESQYGTVSLQSTLNLVSGEGVWVEITSMSPGVRLYGGPSPERNGHFTHFTGWMLEEEIFV